MKIFSGVLLILSLLLSACQSQTGTGALVGTGLGVGAGALIGGGSGALIGGAVGAVGGAVVGHLLEEDDRTQLQNSSPQTLKRIDNHQQLSINDIKKMSDAGISDDKIIEVIHSTGSVYHLTSTDVTELKRAGVSERVIDYMLQTAYSS